MGGGRGIDRYSREISEIGLLRETLLLEGVLMQILNSISSQYVDKLRRRIKKIQVKFHSIMAQNN